MLTREEKYMKLALKEAQKAFNKNEVPVGCVIVLNDKVISKAHNTKESKNNPLCHAEILAINKACKKINDWRLENAELYVTLEPCPMCAGAIMQARIEKVIYGTEDLKNGSVDSLIKLYEVKGYNHYPKVQSNVLKQECSDILKKFFKELRKSTNKEKESLL